MWADALPNLLIGLREGLEAGLVVSILLAALGKPRHASSAPVWLSVAAAATLALSFGAVLTFYRSVLSTSGQESLAGALSIVAVFLVTWMIFWMRRTARGLAGQLREQVDAALKVSGTALAFTAFLAVGREGLETSLFLWTAAQASGQTVAPLVGAAAGIAIATGLCVLLYRRVVRIRLDKFFGRTAVLLIVIAGGVLAYGLGDLQDAGLLPGHLWVAFDLSSHVDTGSWWMSILTGITELTPKMTWLQVVAYLSYLAVVLNALQGVGVPSAPSSGAKGTSTPIGARLRAVAAAALLVPPIVAGLLIGFAPRSQAGSQLIRVTGSTCATGWASTSTGAQTFTVENDSSAAAEVTLVQAASQGIVAEIETLGPGTRQPVSATLTTGTYAWRCLLTGQPATLSATVTASGEPGSTTAIPVVKQVTVAELQPVLTAYTRYVAGLLATMGGQVARIESDLRDADMAAARADWVSADLTWQRVGEEPYGSFGDYGVRIDAAPQGFAGGVSDPRWTGLRRLEYGLWHGQSPASLLKVADTLASDVSALRRVFTRFIAPTDLPVRAHEVLEDALRDELSGAADQGSGDTYRELAADVAVTRVVLGELAPLLTSRSPGLLPTVSAELAVLDSALRATGWRPLASTALPKREAVDAAVGAALETLADVPDLLETPAH